MRCFSAFRRRLATKTVTFQRRYGTDQVPSEDDVRKACAALGISASSPFHEVKKRYVELAKLHHPDVNGSGNESVDNKRDSSRKMVDINAAYSTLSQLHKSCKATPRNPSEGHHSNGSSSGSSHAYYTTGDEPYQPWHEDLNPLIYEMMWDEMRRQAERESFSKGHDRDQRRPPNAQSKSRGTQSGDGGGGRGRGRGKGTSPKNPKPRDAPKRTTWPDADLQAMVNMYQDGKSFEFIANALGKKTPDVVAEFNRWSEDHKRSSRPPQRRRGYAPNKSYYYAESPEGDFMDFDESDDPYGYGDGEEDEVYSAGINPEHVFFDGGAIPFHGGHYMSGHRAGRGGGAAAPFHRGRRGTNGAGNPHRWS